MPPPKSKKPLVYLDPIVITPKDKHRNTVIILHGRGSTAEKFASPLLDHPVAALASHNLNPSTPPKAFREYFPHTKFIFPTAPLRRAVAFNRSLTHQWFDNWSLTEPEVKEHLQIPGLREASAYLHDLIREEMNVVGSRNIVLMGLSQGCAASLVSAMLWTGEAIGAVVGMSGYLPFAKAMAECVDDCDDGGEDAFSESELEDVFIRDGSGYSSGETKPERAVAWLREELEMDGEKGSDRAAPGILDIPVFMGHGREDEKVPLEVNRSATEFLSSMGVKLECKEYQGLGHWYSDEMLRDVIGFLKRLEGWEDVVNEEVNTVPDREMGDFTAIS